MQLSSTRFMYSRSLHFIRVIPASAMMQVKERSLDDLEIRMQGQIDRIDYSNVPEYFELSATTVTYTHTVLAVP